VANLAFGTSYYVTIDAGAITDLAGNPFAGITGSTAFNFETQFQFNTITGTSSAETLNGTAGVDHIYGLGGNDTLNGNGDNDLLDGGTGTDRMAGGAGNDTYVVDNTSDIVTESTSAGTDTVRTSLSSHTLASNVENLVYTGTSAFSGTGNSLNNTITGGIGNDTLRGNSGSDTLSGGDGADVLRGGTGKDFLFGCGGADRFDFDTTSEAGIGSTCDVIEDFAMGDRIDLSTIDANTSIDGNQAFSGTLVSAFTGVKGQLRVVDAGDHLIVSGDRNGDRIADFDIQVVTTLDTLSSSDFIL
jgi:Ca2+-binding RTX toxin-like protein